MATCLTTRRTLATLISRALSHSPQSSPLFTAPRLSLTLLTHKLSPMTGAPVRLKTSGSGYSPLNDSAPNWSNRPPKETILLDGCDYEHWLIVMEFTGEPKPSEEEMISAYVKALASVVGSEEEAKKKIYSVSTTTYTGFGALIPEELSYKMKEIPGVLWVLPDSYLDVPNKDYGGDLFVDGKVIHRPQYRYDDRQPTRSRPRVRYDRRRENMQTERREPMRRDNLAQDRREPINQPTAVNGQNGPHGGGGGSSWNQGGEPMRRDNWAQDRREPINQTAAVNVQNGPHGGGGVSSWNQGGEPVRRDNWAQDRREPIYQPAAVDRQNGPQGGDGGSSWNQ